MYKILPHGDLHIGHTIYNFDVDYNKGRHGKSYLDMYVCNEIRVIMTRGRLLEFHVAITHHVLECFSFKIQVTRGALKGIGGYICCTRIKGASIIFVSSCGGRRI